MPKYEVEIHETIRYTVTVEASNAATAKQIATSRVWQSGIVRRIVKSIRVLV